MFNGADRGGKIVIEDSTFTTSRFCKGLIVYRPAYYESTISNLRLSDIYGLSNDPSKAVNNRDSHILIKNSKFTNLNFYSQVDALAITGSSQMTWYYSVGVMEDEDF